MDPVQCASPSTARLWHDRWILLVVLVVMVFGVPVARADSILLRGGERLIGKVVAEEKDRISFESQALGVVEIPRDRIERIERDTPPPPPPPAGSAKPVLTGPDEKSILPAPPAKSATPVVPTDSATAAPLGPDQQSILPAPPPAPTSPKGPAENAAPVPVGPDQNPAPPVKETAPVASNTPETPAALVKQTAPATVVEPPSKLPDQVSTVEVSPAKPPAAASSAPPSVTAPAVVPVFYPWSGLQTEQDVFDWIQLNTGEWLKGKIKGMQEYSLVFNSEKMDLLTFDWEDIATLRSPRLNRMRFEQAGRADGSLLITGNEVRVVTTSGTTTYPRTDLLAITPAGTRERNNWTGKLTLGLNLRAGNTKEVSYNASANIQRRTPLTRLNVDYLGNFSDINSVVSEENQRVTGQFDYFLSRKTYIRLPDAEYFRDPLQNINDRLTLGAGIGYDFYRTPRFEWDVSAGPGYSKTRYISVEADQNKEEKAFAALFGTHLDWQVTQLIDWTLDYRAQVAGKESSGTTQHTNSTVEFEIHKRLKLNLSFIWDRVGNPKADASGTTPKPDDFRLITSLGVEF